jgi:hypothetical protein
MAAAHERLTYKAFAGKWNKLALAIKFGAMRGPDGEWLGLSGQPEYIEKAYGRL